MNDYIPVGSVIYCPNCGRELYKFRFAMPFTTILVMLPHFVEGIFPQPSFSVTPKAVHCEYCRKQVNILEQVRDYVILNEMRKSALK